MERRFNIPQKTIDHLIDLAFEEDIGTGDITTRTLISPALETKAIFLAKSEGVLAGVDVARRVFLKLDPEITFKIFIKDGSTLQRGDIIAEVKGKARAILTGERTALNFLQRLSGIATHTSQFVERVSDLPVMIIDTRKTAPG